MFSWSCSPVLNRSVTHTYVHTGDDKHQSPLVTGLELERVRAYSMSAGIVDRISAIGDQRDSLTGQLNNYG